jgi:hypothetical protein
MYYKDDLLAKDFAELVDIANELGADASISDKESLVYDILEKQASAEAVKNPLGQKRKRTRILKKDTDHVYTVNGKDGENLDMKKNKVAANEPAPLFKDVTEDAEKPQQAEEVSMATEEMAAEPTEEKDADVVAETTDAVAEAAAEPEAGEPSTEPTQASQQEGEEVVSNEELLAQLEEELKTLSNHRGRKSKREQELIATIEALKAQMAEQEEEGEDDIVPEAMFAQGNADDDDAAEKAERDALKEAIAQQAREDEQPSSATFTLRKILGGDILTAHLMRSQIWLVVLIVFFMVAYISNRYSVQKDLLEIDRLNKELKDAKYKALSSSSQLTEKCRESHVLEVIRHSKDSILKMPSQPPYIITVPKNK